MGAYEYCRVEARTKHLLIRRIPVGFHAQFLDFSGQGVAPPAQQMRGFDAPSAGVFERDADQGFFKFRYQLVEYANFAVRSCMSA